MKKKLSKIIIMLFATVLLVAMLVACNENTKQDAVTTDIPDGAKVENNGGVAVKYGNYLYFINGLAGETANNEFGKVVKGAVMRVDLKDGKPDYTTVKTIVPKNVYGEDKTNGGIYIVNGYIYYNTTSVDKDKDLNYRSTRGVFMRTSLDGSKSEVIKELDDNDISIYAGDNSSYLVYVYDNILYSVDKDNNIKCLTNATYNGTNSDRTEVAHLFKGDYAIFTMYDYDDTENYTNSYLVNVFDLKSGELKTVMSSATFNGENENTLYKTTVKSASVGADGKLTLYYTKEDNSANGKSAGFYVTTLDENLTFRQEYRYTQDTTTHAYTAFYTLSNGYTLAFSGKEFDVYNANGTRLEKGEGTYDKATESPYVTLSLGNDVTIAGVYENADEVYTYFVYSSKLNYVKLFDKDKNDGKFNVAEENAVAFFGGSYDATFVSYDIIDGVIYYLNSNMKSNAYYYVIPAIKDIDADTKISEGKILGVIDAADEAELLKESASKE